MKQILFPTAYSTASKAAFRYTQKLAQYFDAGITLVHIYESPSLSLASNSIVGKDLEAFASNQRKQEMERLQTFATELYAKQFHTIPLDFIVADGNVVEELRQIQTKKHFDLLVMGMRRHPNSDRLLGKSAKKMIDQLNCALLLVPPNTKYLGLEKLVYGTALEMGDQTAIEYLLDWCKAFEATLHVLHITNAAQVQEATQKLEEALQSYAIEVEAGIITKQLLTGKIKEALTEYIEFTGADILAVHKRKQGFWQRILEGSLTKTLVEEIQVPLLVLKS